MFLCLVPNRRVACYTSDFSTTPPPWLKQTPTKLPASERKFWYGADRKYDLLRDSFYALKREAAPGVDGVTWNEYETGLEDRLVDLHSRVHRGAYRAQPSRRVYIPKADGRQCPLGVAALEDKIVQQAVVTILNQIYEMAFPTGFGGSRPASGAGCADGGNPTEASELGARCGHSKFLRQFESRMDVEVHRAPRGRSPETSPDPEMVDGGSIGNPAAWAR